MQALRFHGPDDLRLEEIPRPESDRGDVLICVEACGICGSDLHFVDGTARTDHTPITLGHEIAGRVEDPGTSQLSPGSPVVLQVGSFCGECPRCLEGRENLCQRASILGIDVDGGLAEFILVSADMVIPRPESLSAIEAATAVDAGATALHAVTRSAGLTRGDSVAIIGIGGLGGYAVQIAIAGGAGPVIAVDTEEAALERATALGADETVLNTPDISVGRAIKMLTEGGVDVALEFVGRAATVDAAVKSLRPGGRAVVVGVGIEPITTLPPVLWSNNEYTLTGSYGSLPGDAERILTDLSQGSLEAPASATVPLAKAVDAIVGLSRDRLTSPGGRLEVVP